MCGHSEEADTTAPSIDKTTRRSALKAIGSSAAGGLLLSGQGGAAAATKTLNVAVHAQDSVSSSTHYDTYEAIRDVFDDHINPYIRSYLDVEVDVLYGTQWSFDPSVEQSDDYGGWKALENDSYWNDYIDYETTHTFLVYPSWVDEATNAAPYFTDQDHVGYGYSYRDIGESDVCFSVTNVGALETFDDADKRRNLAIHEVLHTFDCSHNDGSYDVVDSWFGKEITNITPMATSYVVRAGTQNDTFFTGTGDVDGNFCHSKPQNVDHRFASDAHIQEPSECSLSAVLRHLWFEYPDYR